jgi:hypothetical protein
MPIIDPFEGHESGLGGPYKHGAAITPHNSNELATLPRALVAYTTAGTCAVTLAGGEEVTVYLALGIPVEVRAKVVKATGTTAVGITALW